MKKYYSKLLCFVLLVFTSFTFSQTMMFTSGATEPGFTLNGWGTLTPGSINQSNLAAPSTVSVNTGTFNIVSFSVGPFAGGNTITVSSNLGDTFSYNSAILTTHTLNWTGITTLTFTRTGGSGAAADYDNFVYTLGAAPCTDPDIPTITATPATICPSGNSTLTWTGSLNDATAWHVYTTSCGITQLSTTTGNSLVVSPGATTTYYIRGEGGCVAPGSCSSATVTVTDSTNPVITVCASTPANISANGSCQGTAPDLTGSVTATDNCTGSPIITQSPAAGATLGLGTTTITLTATDGSGNTAQCMVNQTVVDTTNPVITVCASTPANISANGSCQGTAPDLTGSVTATDNCTGSPTITQSPAAGATLGLGTTTITLTATDGSGNTAQCMVNQTVVDTTNPVITVCASTPANISANGSCQGTAPDLTGSVTATDNCTGSPTITQSPAAGATLGLGTTTITLTATDGSGNTAQCMVNQTVVDTTNPVITVCASTPANISANGSCQGTAPDLTGSVTATDNCTGSPTITQSPAAGATLGLGTTTITLTATDGSGNTAQCMVNQTVVDTTNPVITVCASTPANISANGSCQGTAPDLTGSVTATDNCTGSPTITQSPAAGATLGLGTTTITLTATDGSGNTAQCMVNQTVVDTTNPVITVCASTPANISANGSCQGIAPDLTGSVTATDNCTGSPTITQSPAAGATLGLGTTTITLTATDGSGNTAQCMVNQTVVDTTNPVITVCASTPANISANGSCQGIAPDLTGSVTATDNCTGSPTITQSPAAGATLGLGTTTITLTATDGSGNTAQCMVNQTVVDTTNPVITVCASTPANISANGSCQGIAPDLTGSVTATDNCTGSPTITQSPAAGATLGLGTTTITLTATDGSGNTAQCMVNQTVVDNTAPIVTCSSGTQNVSDDGTGDCTFTPVAVGQGGSYDINDNCSGTLTVQEVFTGALTATATWSLAAGGGPYTPVQAFPVGITTVTVTVTDASGNSSSCMYTTTILDDEVPVVTCPADLTIECDADSTPANTGTATATDNCDASPTVTFSDAVTAGVGSNSSIARTWTATDANGNTSNCIQTITVVDTTAPVVTCPADLTIECDADNSPANTGTATATDNCDASPTVTFSDAVTAGVGSNSSIARTWTATDVNGNTSSCIQTITVVDTTAPVVTCPADLTIECDADNSPANTGTATATDNCDASPTVTFSDAVTAGIGSNSSIARTWTATDANGNTSNCVQIITVVDTTAPVADVAVLADVTAECSVASLVAPTATDNCAGMVTVTNNAVLPITMQGTTIVTWTYEDGNGNTSMQTQNVVITDITFPIVITQNITIALDDSGEANILASDIDNGSSDNCSFTLSLDIDTFDCFNLGDYTVTLSAEDIGGNITTATATVTIIGDDNDNDGMVDACDDDDDNDGVLDIDDNCHWTSNPNQVDLDEDNIGDICDDFVDILVTANDTITPNGDGFNDTWYIENIWRYPNASVQVFNRHGVKVFEGRNYNNDWNAVSTEGGSGTLPANSYYYIINLNQPEFGEYGVTPVTGWFYINY